MTFILLCEGYDDLLFCYLKVVISRNSRPELDVGTN
jgi:hypothetical protein